MIRFIGRLIKWLLLFAVLLVVGSVSPVAYVELFCRGEVRQDGHTPLIADAAFRRPEANTYLTYPEWHIVYAYDGLAETLKTGDEYQFSYLSSLAGFWSSTCRLMKMADEHGGADQATRMMIYTKWR
jgi:hypothetical protein